MSAPTKPLILYTVPTPNGVPISIFLEELKVINPTVDYEWALCKTFIIDSRLTLDGQRRKDKLSKEYAEGIYHILARLHSSHWTIEFIGTLVHQDES